MIKAQVLSQLLVMQSVVISLTDESIFSFICRGLLDMPGVSGVRYTETSQEQVAATTVRIPLHVGDTYRGELLFTVTDPEAFAPYVDYLNNFGYMLAVILEERSQRRQNEVFQSQLEMRVQERTMQLQEQIAERQLIEQSLRASEERLRLALDAAHMGTFDWDIPQNHITWSRWHEELWGFKPGEFGGTYEAFSERVYPDDLPGINDEVARCIAAREQFVREFRVVWPDGSVHWVQARGEFIFSGDDKPARMRGAVVETTSRKRAEITLVSELQILEMIFSGAALPEVLEKIVLSIESLSHETIASILLLDPDGLHVHYGAAPNLPEAYNHALEGAAIGPNAGSCGTAAYRREMVIVSDIETDPLWADYRELARAYELRACWSTPIMISEGKVLGTFAMYYREPRSPREEDFELISRATHIAGIAIERKKAEEALRQSEERYRNLFETIQDGIYRTDRDGVLVLINPAGAQMFGHGSPEEMIGKKALEYWLDPADREVFQKELREKKSLIAYHIRARKITGEDLYLETTSIILEDNSGNFIGIEGIFRDITERLKLEEQLRQAQKMEAIGTLAGGVAHDFNNILSAIIGYGHIMRTKMARDDKLREHLDQILAAADRAANLTGGLLAFSRKQILSRKPVDLNEIVTGLLKFLRRIIGEDISLKSSIAESVVSIMADRGQIEQVLMNLVTNARDAMPDGGTLEIATSIETIDNEFIQAHGFGISGQYALLTVSDSGMGMDSQTCERIFEPFFTTKEVGKGTGLGLSTIYGIVKQHDGFINVYSEPGQGTTFKIYFPLIKAAEQKEQVIVERARPRGGNETILVAEDDMMLRKLATTILGESGYRVIVAEDGDDAIEKFKTAEHEISLVILDVVMPKRSGKEVFDIISKEHPGLRAIFTSGYTADLMHQKGVLDESLDFLFKPVLPGDLLRKVREVLDRK